MKTRRQAGRQAGEQRVEFSLRSTTNTAKLKP